MVSEFEKIKEMKRLLYILFYLIGALSIYLSNVISWVLSGIIVVDFRIIYLFPFVISSIILSIILYILKEKLLNFWLKSFLVSFAAIIGFLLAPIFGLVFFIFLILFIGLTTFKEKPLIDSKVKALVGTGIAILILIFLNDYLGLIPRFFMGSSTPFYTISNSDVNSHTVTVEIFEDGRSISNRTYEVSPNTMHLAGYPKPFWLIKPHYVRNFTFKIISDGEIIEIQVGLDAWRTLDINYRQGEKSPYIVIAMQ